MAWVTKFTNNGIDMMDQIISGASLILTKVETGTGTTVSMETATAVSSPVTTGGLRIVVKQDSVSIKIKVLAYTDTYLMKQIGIFAKVDNGEEKLFALMQNADGVNIPDADDFKDFSFNVTLNIRTSRASSFSATVDSSALVSTSQFDETVATLATKAELQSEEETRANKDLVNVTRSGLTFTFTFGDGTSITCDQKDDNTTYQQISRGSGAGLAPGLPSGSGTDKFLREDGQWATPITTAGIVNIIYPVGSIYMSVNTTSPETLFGGTWERLKDRFLLGAGDTYGAGSTGGAASRTYTPAGTVGNTTLTLSQIPSHNHTFTGTAGNTGNQSNDHTHNYTDYYADTETGSTALTVAQIPSHSHTITAPFVYQTTDVGAWTDRVPRGGIEGSSYIQLSWSCAGVGGNEGHTHSVSNTSATRKTAGMSANHTHSFTPSGTISSSGGGGAHNHGFTGTEASIPTMPPYLAVYMWKRAA